MQGSDKHQMMYDEASGKVSLLIKAIGPGDEGEYTCTALNPYGEAICTVYISPEATKAVKKSRSSHKISKSKSGHDQQMVLQQQQVSFMSTDTVGQAAAELGEYVDGNFEGRANEAGRRGGHRGGRAVGEPARHDPAIPRASRDLERRVGACGVMTKVLPPRSSSSRFEDPKAAEGMGHARWLATRI